MILKRIEFHATKEQRHEIEKLIHKLQEYIYVSGMYDKKKHACIFAREEVEEQEEELLALGVPVWVIPEIENIVTSWKSLGNYYKKLKNKNIFLFSA